MSDNEFEEWIKQFDGKYLDEIIGNPKKKVYLTADQADRYLKLLRTAPVRER